MSGHDSQMTDTEVKLTNVLVADDDPEDRMLTLDNGRMIEANFRSLAVISP